MSCKNESPHKYAAEQICLKVATSPSKDWSRKTAKSQAMDIWFWVIRHCGYPGFMWQIVIQTLRTRSVQYGSVNGAVFLDHSNRQIQEYLEELLRESTIVGSVRQCTYSASLGDRFTAVREILRGYSQLRDCHIAARPLVGGKSSMRFYSLIAHYGLFRVLLARSRPGSLLVIDDLSPNRMAAILAASDIGIPLGYVLMNGLDRPYPPVPAKTTFLRSPRQLAFYKGESEFIAVRPMLGTGRHAHSPSSTLRVGIALNAWGNQTHAARLASEIHRVTPTADIRVRFHPRSSCSFISSIPGCTISVPSLESSLDFLKRCDVLIAGRTTLVEEAIDYGIPVGTVEEMDTIGGRPYPDEEESGIKELRRPLGADWLSELLCTATSSGGPSELVEAPTDDRVIDWADAWRDMAGVPNAHRT